MIDVSQLGEKRDRRVEIVWFDMRYNRDERERREGLENKYFIQRQEMPSAGSICLSLPEDEL